MHEPHPGPTAESSAALWAPLARFVAVEERFGRWAAQRPGCAADYEFVRFGIKQDAW
jgi:hypothetical protein